MPRLLIENVFLKSRINREVHVRFREELGVKIPLLTRLAAGFCLAVVGCLTFYRLALIGHRGHRFSRLIIIVLVYLHVVLIPLIYKLTKVIHK